jgi:cbb3-type cytochrome oxidase subunit 3
MSGLGLFSFLNGTIAALLCFIGAPCYLLSTKRKTFSVDFENKSN